MSSAGNSALSRQWLFRNLRQQPALVLAGLVATVWMVYFGLGHMQGFSPDARSYIETTERLLDGRGFGPTNGGTSTTHFPPGLPLLMAPIGKMGISITNAALFINWLSWLASLAAASVLYRRSGGRTTSWYSAVFLWLAVSASIVHRMGSVLSEPVSLALSLWLLIVAERWLSSERAWGYGLASVVLGSVLISVRYVGVFIVIAVAIRAVQEGGGPARVTRRYTVIGLSILPTAIWYCVYQSGPRQDAPGVSPEAVTLANIWHSFGTLGSILGGGISYSLEGPSDLGRRGLVTQPLFVAMGLAAALAGIAFLVYWWYRSAGGRQARGITRARETGHLLIVDSVIVYVVGMALYRIPSGYSIITRYWVLVVVPVAIVTAAHLSRRLERRGRETVPLALGVICVLAVNTGVTVISIG